MSYNVLLVEDNPGDADLVKIALEETQSLNKLYMVYDGEQALNFLQRREGFSNVPRPDLILLDLNLPKVDGREVLKRLKKDQSLKLIPIIVLTTSRAEDDVFKCYNLRANCYINKPLDLDDFFGLVGTIDSFWMNTVQLPMEGYNA